MRRLLLIAAVLIAASTAMQGACASGFIQITDTFLNPDGSAWSGSIVYTLAYNTTVAGQTIVGARQQFNVTSGISRCLAPGLYTPVTLQQSGFSYVQTTSWGVPIGGGPYTIAQIQGNITLTTSVGAVTVTTPYLTLGGTASAPNIAANASATGGTSNLLARDSNGNSAVNNIANGRSGNACAGTITLTAASAGSQDFTSGSGSCTLVLPDATTLNVNVVYYLNMNASGTLTVNFNGGGTLLTVPAGGFARVSLQSNSFSAGQWDYHYYLPSNAPCGTAGCTTGGSSTATSHISTAVAPTVAANQIGYGGTTVAASNCGSLAGAAGCVQINIGGTAHYMPYY